MCTYHTCSHHIPAHHTHTFIIHIHTICMHIPYTHVPYTCTYSLYIHTHIPYACTYPIYTQTHIHHMHVHTPYIHTYLPYTCTYPIHMNKNTYTHTLLDTHTDLGRHVFCLTRVLSSHVLMESAVMFTENLHTPTLDSKPLPEDSQNDHSVNA